MCSMSAMYTVEGQLLAMGAMRYCLERTPRFPELRVAVKFRLNAMAPMTDYSLITEFALDYDRKSGFADVGYR